MQTDRLLTVQLREEQVKNRKSESFFFYHLRYRNVHYNAEKH